MTNLKEYFYNTNHYSDPIIKKFIYDFTDKFNPFLLISLNKEFLNSYLLDLDEINEGKVKHDNDPSENLLGNETLDKMRRILCRVYSYSDGIFKIDEVLEQYYNLSYVHHKTMYTKIQDFQICMHEIILWLNSESICFYNPQPTSKAVGAIFSRNHWNKNAFNLFNYLDDNYEKKGKIKYINIFKFLKNADKKRYAFNFTEDTFRAFIFNLKELKITKFATAEFAYYDKELPILNSFEELFRKDNSN